MLRRVLLGTAVTALLVVAGVVALTVVGGPDGYFTHVSVRTVQRYLDAAPVPDGAVLVVEETNEGHADVTTSVTREYRLSGTTSPCVQVLTAILASGWEFRGFGQTTALTTPGECARVTSGYLHPRNWLTGAVTVTWDGPRLWYILTESDVPD